MRDARRPTPSRDLDTPEEMPSAEPTHPDLVAIARALRRAVIDDDSAGVHGELARLRDALTRHLSHERDSLPDPAGSVGLVVADGRIDSAPSSRTPAPHLAYGRTARRYDPRDCGPRTGQLVRSAVIRRPTDPTERQCQVPDSGHAPLNDSERSAPVPPADLAEVPRWLRDPACLQSRRPAPDRLAPGRRCPRRWGAATPASGRRGRSRVNRQRSVSGEWQRVVPLPPHGAPSGRQRPTG
jgi:hypothetical protein